MSDINVSKEIEIPGSDPERMGKWRRAPSVRDVIARHGLTDSIKPSMDEVDRLTGKRLGEDDN